MYNFELFALDEGRFEDPNYIFSIEGTRECENLYNEFIQNVLQWEEEV